MSAYGTRLTLHRLSREGQVAAEVIVQGTCTSSCTSPTPYQLLPDGLGGLLFTASWNVSSNAPFDLRLTRFDGAGGRTDTPIAGSAVNAIELIGQGGTAYLRVTSGAATVSQPVMDLLTWTPRWSLPIEWTLLAASPDGGAVAQNAAGDLARFDGTGQLLGTTPVPGLRNPVQEFGGWVGNSASGLRSVAGTFDDATRWDATRRSVFWSGQEQYGFGGRQRNSAQRKPGTGIFVKSHYAEPGIGGVFRYRHLSIRVAPHNQVRWRQDLATEKDQFDNYYFTFGAGPVGGDTTVLCSGTLTAGINRDKDVTVPPLDPLELLTYPLAAEDGLIQELLERFAAYDNDLPYACFPDNNPGYYNSNSFAAGLLRAAGLGQPRFALRLPALFPGVSVPVPLAKFQ